MASVTVMRIGGKSSGFGKKPSSETSSNPFAESDDDTATDGAADPEEAKREAFRALGRALSMKDVDEGVEALEAFVKACSASSEKGGDSW